MKDDVILEQPRSTSSAPGYVLWRRDDTPVERKVGIAGDFLPAGHLLPLEGCTWSDMADALAAYFHDLDVAFANLECPVDVHDSLPRVKWGMGDNFSAPKDALSFLTSLKAKVIGLANNHIYDHGASGVQYTKRAIQDCGVDCIGGGVTLAQTPDVFVLVEQGIRIGFWAAARGLAEGAKERSEGVEPATRSRAEQALQELKKQNAVFSVALLHAGLEHTNRPDPDDVELMDDLAHLGFDVVAACHSHRISGYKLVSREGGGPAFCFYGLGSLSSGVIYSELEREGLVVVAGLDEKGAIAQIEVRPIDLGTTGWGRVPESEPREVMLQRFVGLSDEIQDGSYRSRFYKDIGAGLFQRHFRDVGMAFRQGGLKGLLGKFGRVRMRHVRRLVHQCRPGF